MEEKNTGRQVVKYTFYKLDTATFLRLPEQKQRDAKLDLIDTVRSFNRRMLLRSYSLVGMRRDVDFLLWTVAEEVEAVSAVGNGHPQHGVGPVSDGEPLVSLRHQTQPVRHQPAGRSAQAHAEERIRIEPGGSRYLFVYPFIKTRAWYALSQEERQEMITEHIRIGRKYPDIRLNTTYSYGIDDQEFVVAFEGDDPHDFVDLVNDLRFTEASMYTLSDTPMHICIAMNLPEVLDSIGGAQVSDLRRRRRDRGRRLAARRAGGRSAAGFRAAGVLRHAAGRAVPRQRAASTR